MERCPNCKIEQFRQGLCESCRDVVLGQSTEARCMECGVTESLAKKSPLCYRRDQVDFGDHIFLRDLFQRNSPPVSVNVEDEGMDDAPRGLGLPGECFDLRCADCGKESLQLKKSVHGLFYGCPSWPSCKGTHGAHPDGRPKGIPGDKKTRLARIAAHEAFDPLFKGTKSIMREHEAYAWMATEMGLSTYEAHIAMFDIAKCEKLIQIVNKKLGPSAWTHLEEDPFETDTPLIAERDEPHGVESIDTVNSPYVEVTLQECEVFPLSTFVEHCRRGYFSDYDGIGFFGTARVQSNEQISCSAMAGWAFGFGYTSAHHTHVYWYNK